MSLEGKVALVTGSTSGIGKAIAIAFAQQGCKVLVNGLGNEEEIKEVMQEIIAASSHKNASFIHCEAADLRDPAQIKTMITQCEHHLGPIDILVNNAGIQFVSPVEEFPDEQWQAVQATNLSAAFYAIKQVIPSMRKKGFGRIINIASAHGLVASANKTAYVAAKHGVVGLTKSLALETAGAGITANSICPGWVLTPLVEKQIHALAEKNQVSYEVAKVQLLSEKQPSKEFVLPEDVGALAVFLSGPHAKGITGTTIAIDGGWTAQ